jgi:AbrB family looped-hinge helix DNA binding protein
MEALIAIDGRGQIVLPKDVRTKAGIEPGDKLAVITCEDEGEICCLLLLKADSVAKVIKGMLGPTIAEIMGQ